MKKLLLAILSAAGVCTGCAAADGDELLAPCEFRRAVAADTAAYVLDVRHAAEYAEGHLQGAHLLDVLDGEAFDAGMKRLDRKRTYYIYCRSGRRSHAAWQKFTAEGFRAFDLEGGIIGWQKEGLPVVR